MHDVVHVVSHDTLVTVYKKRYPDPRVAGAVTTTDHIRIVVAEPVPTTWQIATSL